MRASAALAGRYRRPRKHEDTNKRHYGSVAEWLKATVLKTVVPERVS